MSSQVVNRNRPCSEYIISTGRRSMMMMRASGLNARICSAADWL
jgi:hypothetical protein